MAVIIARGGSKSIPRKNVRPLAGKPMIVYTFEAALKSRRLERVFLSTDSEEIAALGRQCGVDVPCLRPAELAGDEVIGVLPVLHMVEWLEKHRNYTPDLVVLLQATSPLRPAEAIDEAIERLEKSGADAVVGVSPVEHHPYRMKQVDAQGRMINYVSLDKADVNRQTLPELFIVNGAVYVIRREVLLKGRSLFPDNTQVVVMPPETAMDVDSPWDLHVVDLILKDKGGGRKPET